MVEIKFFNIEKAKELGIENWTPFERMGPATIDWTAEEQEAAYIMEGETSIIINDTKIDLRPGNMVLFPKSTTCTWITPQYYKKVYINDFYLA